MLGLIQPLVITTMLCGGVLWSYAQDSINDRLPHQSSSITSPVEEQHNDCPPPLGVVTFLQRQICVHACLGEKLAAANELLQKQGFTKASTLDIRRISGFRPGQRSLHGQGLAIDINAETNPYLIHEYNETRLDVELASVYERIAQFILGRSSIIPHLGRERRAKETRRAYVARFYDALAQESIAMQRYFEIMLDGKQLRQYIQTTHGAQRARSPATFLSVFIHQDRSRAQTRSAGSTPVSNATLDQFRFHMMSDWTTLTGYAGPPVQALDHTDAALRSRTRYLPYPEIPPPQSDDPAKGEVDRPFDPEGKAYAGRSPLKGFLSLRKELVLALVDVGFRWGALDFDRASGDVMHFDSRETSCGVSNDREPRSTR